MKCSEDLSRHDLNSPEPPEHLIFSKSQCLFGGMEDLNRPWGWGAVDGRDCVRTSLGGCVLRVVTTVGAEERERTTKLIRSMEVPLKNFSFLPIILYSVAGFPRRVGSFFFKITRGLGDAGEGATIDIRRLG